MRLMIRGTHRTTDRKAGIIVELSPVSTAKVRFTADDQEKWVPLSYLRAAAQAFF